LKSFGIQRPSPYKSAEYNTIKLSSNSSTQQVINQYRVIHLFFVTGKIRALPQFAWEQARINLRMFTLQQAQTNGVGVSSRLTCFMQVP